MSNAAFALTNCDSFFGLYVVPLLTTGLYHPHTQGVYPMSCSFLSPHQCHYSNNSSGFWSAIITHRRSQSHSRTLRYEPLEDRCMLSVGNYPELPGLLLVDPVEDQFNGQIIYLDSDGEHGVTYDGPVTIENINIPSFTAPGELAGQEDAIIAGVLQQLSSIFADTGLTFITEIPVDDTVYSTIYIGGTDAPFAEYGSFLGLAEKVDMGNADRADHAFVFSSILGVPEDGLSGYTTRFSEIVAHETGRLLGYENDSLFEDPGPLDSVAARYYSIYGHSQTHFITVTPGDHCFVVDVPFGVSLWTEWYVNGFYMETDRTSLSNFYADPELCANFPYGTFEILARIFDNNINHLEDHRWIVTAGGQPDFIVQDISINPSNPETSQSVTVIGTFANTGNCYFEGLIDVIYRIAGSTYGPDKIFLGLDPGESISIPLDPPIEIECPGFHSMTVTIDPFNSIPELDETNNSRTETFRWRGPDLIIHNVFFSPSNPIVGQSFKAIVMIQNQGDGRAQGPIEVCFSVNGSYYECTISGLWSFGPGDYDYVPMALTPMACGVHSIRFIIDPTNEICEWNEDNNDVITFIEVVGADLVINNVTVSDETVYPGQQITVTWIANNQGAIAADITQTGVLWSTNSIISGSDQLLAIQPLSHLNPFQYEYQFTSILIPIDAVHGQTYYIGVYVDYFDDQEECDESNNVSYIALRINRKSDFNGDGTVDASDLAIWKDGFGTTTKAKLEEGDADSDGDVDGTDFLAWQLDFGAEVSSGSGSGIELLSYREDQEYESNDFLDHESSGLSAVNESAVKVCQVCDMVAPLVRNGNSNETASDMDNRTFFNRESIESIPLSSNSESQAVLENRVTSDPSCFIWLVRSIEYACGVIGPVQPLELLNSPVAFSKEIRIQNEIWPIRNRVVNDLALEDYGLVTTRTLHNETVPTEQSYGHITEQLDYDSLFEKLSDRNDNRLNSLVQDRIRYQHQ